MPRFVSSFTFAATVLALAWQTGCSSDEGDGDDSSGGTSGSSTGGSSGSSSGGTGGSGTSPCGMPCGAGDFCSQCFNPSNPDEPLYACIAEGTSC
ncbi:MAG TPA: hypothetical protein VMS65_06015 [Polyangiaceae bacterium]|nr:hypothetical protein [Polyangiaceae bacterium]